MQQIWKEMNGRLKTSIRIAFEIVTGISTLVGIWGFTIRDISDKLKWWHCLLMLILLYVIAVLIVYQILKFYQHRTYITKIKGKTVTIKTGDIFNETGIKVIPCNEYYDTQVDNIIISSNTLNGKMIQEHIQNLSDLNTTIKKAVNDDTKLTCPKKNGDKWQFPLGRIIRYKDYGMLAFTHFNEQNEAHIQIGEYEQCLLRMWMELRRVYSGDHIVLPLIGAGITDIEGVHQKDNTFLLKCILCTLKNSLFIPDGGVTIVLTKDVMETVDMNKIREEF